MPTLVLYGRVNEEQLGLGEKGKRYRTATTKRNETTNSGRHQQFNEDIYIEEVVDGDGGEVAPRQRRSLGELSD